MLPFEPSPSPRREAGTIGARRTLENRTALARAVRPDPCFSCERLLRVELNDVLLGDLRGDVLTRRLELHLGREGLLVELNPLRNAAAIDRVERLVDRNDGTFTLRPFTVK